jgi:nuclear GTP-binding protein
VQAAEAKARRKEEKKNLRAQQKSAVKANERGGGEGGSSGEDNDNGEGEAGHLDGIAMLGSVTGLRKSPFESTEGVPTAVSGVSVFASDSTAGAAANNGAPPLLINPDLPHFAAVLDKADVVIEVLDARDPLTHRSGALEARIASKEGQKLMLVLNKIGVLPIPLYPSLCDR